MNLSYHKILNLGDIIDVKDIVSSKNKALYDEITFLYKNIEFRESTDCCRTHYNKEYPNVYIGITKPADEEALTHELLHMKLYNLGFSSDYEDCTNGYKYIKDILINGERLVEDIANNLAHVKMLPYFLQLNYEESKFFSSICNHNVRIEIPSKKYCVTDSEFGFYFTEFIIAFVNLRFTRNVENSEQYDEKSIRLRKVSPDLLKILENSFILWDEALVDYDSKTWFNNLFRDLNSWYEEQKKPYI